MGIAQNTIKKFISSYDNTVLYGKEALDEAVRNSSSYNSWQDVVNNMIIDINHYKDHNNYEGFLMDKCGINIHNDDCGAITGSDAGNGIIKTSESVVQDEGELVYPPEQVTNINEFNVIWPDKSTLSETEQKIVEMLYSRWIKGALNLINESYGLTINDTSDVKDIKIQFTNNERDGYGGPDSTNVASIWPTTQKQEDGIRRTTDLVFEINMNSNTNGNYWNEIDFSNENGLPTNARGGRYVDLTITHELTHAMLAANVNNCQSIPKYINEGLANLLIGKDDSEYHMRTIFNDSNIIKNVVDSEKGWDYSLSSGTNNIVGPMLLRYFAKQANIVQPKGATVDNDFMKLDNTFYNEVWLDGRSVFSGEETYKNDYIKTVDASETTNNILVAGNALDNVIISGSGNDNNLWGGWEGNDTLIGGNGKDTFWVAEDEGNDVIINSNNDVINFWNVKLSDIASINVNNNDISVSFFNGNNVNIVNGRYANNTYILGEENAHWQYTNDNWILTNGGQ